MEALINIGAFVLGYAAITFLLIKGIEKIGGKKVVLVDIEEPTGGAGGGGGGRGAGPEIHEK